MTVPRRVRAQRNPDVPQPNKPRCRVHPQYTLTFSPASLRWECPAPGCKFVVYPKQDDSGRPMMGKGPLELVVHTDEDGKTYHYLRATTNNLMLLLDDIIEGTTITKHPAGHQIAMVHLLVSQVTVLDEYGARREQNRHRARPE